MGGDLSIDINAAGLKTISELQHLGHDLGVRILVFGIGLHRHKRPQGQGAATLLARILVVPRPRVIDIGHQLSGSLLQYFWQLSLVVRLPQLWIPQNPRHLVL